MATKNAKYKKYLSILVFLRADQRPKISQISQKMRFSVQVAEKAHSFLLRIIIFITFADAKVINYIINMARDKKGRFVSSDPASEKTQFKRGGEQVETARRGGIASGESKRALHSTKEVVEMALAMPNVKTGQPNEVEVGAALVREATAGNVEAVKTIAKIRGEWDEGKKKVDVNVEGAIQIDIVGVEEYLKGLDL